WLSGPEFFDVARQDDSFESIGGYSVAGTSLLGGDVPVHTVTAYSTAGLLPTLGVAPLLGRFWTPEEDRPGDPQVVVLGYDLWRTVFKGDPSVIGRKAHADQMPVTIVGVMPQGFDFPGNGVELWVPIGLDPAAKNRGSHNLHVVGRLKPGVSFGQADAQLAGLVRSWGEIGGDHPIDPKQHPMVMRGLQDEIVGPVRWMLWLLQGAVLLVLLIACVNVSNLLLARAEARTKEIAIRTA